MSLQHNSSNPNAQPVAENHRKRSQSEISAASETECVAAKKINVRNVDKERRAEAAAECPTNVRDERILCAIESRLTRLMNGQVDKNSQHDEKQSLDFVIDCLTETFSDETVQRLRKHLFDGLGVVIVKNAVDEETIQRARRWVGEAMVDMYADAYDEQERTKVADEQESQECERRLHETRKMVLAGDLAAANVYRRVSSGCGNGSFGYQFLQYTAPKRAQWDETLLQVRDAVTQEATTERVKFSYLPVFHNVCARLMCASAPTRTMWLLALAGTPERTCISVDSCKVVEGRPVKGQTKTVRTVAHIDEYGARHGQRTNRVQAIINNDTGNMKLFFVLGTRDPVVRRLICEYLGKPDMFTSHGFKRIGTDDRAMKLMGVLDKFSFAPPPKSMVLWTSGTVHFEAVGRQLDQSAATSLPWLANIDRSLHRVESRRNDPSATRLRFVVGTHTPTYDEDTARRLAIIAQRGAVPAHYFSPNQQSAPLIHENTVCLKTTQYKHPRVPSAKEIKAVKAALSPKYVREEFNQYTKLAQHMFGVPQLGVLPPGATTEIKSLFE